MPRRIIVNLVEGDTGPPFFLRFEELDLSDYSSITLRVKLSTGGVFTRSVSPEGASDPEAGSVTWVAGDLVRGDHKAEFVFVRVSDSTSFTLPQHAPLTLRVRADT